MGALRHRGPAGQGAVRRHLVVLAPSGPGEAAAILRDLGTPLLIHQPSYSMLNRWIETEGLLDTLERPRASACIAFTPLAQGMLTDKYLDGVPEGSRASQGKSLDAGAADRRGARRTSARSTTSPRSAGRSLAQMALAWALRDPRVTSVLDRREQRRSSSSRTSPRWTTSTSATTSSPRSTSTPSTPGSTCGGPRARRAATIPDPTTSRQLTPKDFFAGACSLGLILSLGLNYVEVGLDPDGALWTTARVLALAIFVVGGACWFLLRRREKVRDRG